MARRKAIVPAITQETIPAKQLYAVKGQSFHAVELPRIYETNGKEWVSFGARNLFPAELIELYNTSAMHATAVNAITDGIVGGGIRIYGDEYVNTRAESLDEMFEKIALDYELFGGYALSIIWNKEGTRVAEMYHIPFHEVRSGKIDDETQEVEQYYHSLDWANTRKNVPKAYKSFDPTDNKKENSSQIYYVYKYVPGNNVYPFPTYIAALADIALDAKISVWHLANLQNGLSPSMFINFNNGVPPDLERRAIHNEIDKSFSGPENAGRYFLSFSNSAAEAMTVTTVDNANTDIYVSMEERISSRILTAHRVTSGLLLGIKDASGFSSNADEIRTAYGHFMGTVVEPKQKKITSSLEYVLRFFGMNVKLDIIPSRILAEPTATITRTVDGPNATETKTITDANSTSNI